MNEERAGARSAMPDCGGPLPQELGMGHVSRLQRPNTTTDLSNNDFFNMPTELLVPEICSKPEIFNWN